jgi:HSP20 family protein
MPVAFPPFDVRRLTLGRRMRAGWSRPGSGVAHGGFRRHAMKGLALRDRFGGTVERFRDEIDELLQKMLGDGPVVTGSPVWAPRVDVSETDQEFLVKADLPGVEAKNIDVSVAEGVLLLKGERQEERREQKKGYQRYERFAGSFYREIPIPAGVDADKITAESANGVVSIRLPKKPELKPKKIAVQEAR